MHFEKKICVCVYVYESGGTKRRETEKVAEVISEALIAEKISKLEKETDIQGQETESQTGWSTQ